MNQTLRKRIVIALLPGLLGLALIACRGGTPQSDPIGDPFAPDQTVGDEVALAATVNGMPITLSAFERQLAREREGLAALAVKSQMTAALRKKRLTY